VNTGLVSNRGAKYCIGLSLENKISKQQAKHSTEDPMNITNQEFQHNQKHMIMDGVLLAVWVFLFFSSMNKYGKIDLLAMLYAVNSVLYLMTILYKLSNPAIALKENHFEAKLALLRQKIIVDYGRIAKLSANDKSFLITLIDSKDIKIPKRILNEEDREKFINSLSDKVKTPVERSEACAAT
jgi:Ca2+/Na+ antiporter